MYAAQDDTELRRWLTELRERAGLSKIQAAEAMGVSPREIRRWENENAPGALNLLRLLNTYGVVFSEPPPDGIPGGYNAELAAVRHRLERIERQVAAAGPQSTIMDLVEALAMRLAEDPEAQIPAGELEQAEMALRRLVEGISQVAEALSVRRQQRDVPA